MNFIHLATRLHCDQAFHLSLNFLIQLVVKNLFKLFNDVGIEIKAYLENL